MFSAIARVFRTPDLRRKIAFTLGIIAIYRLGAHVPTPFVDFPNVQQCLNQSGGTEGLLSLVNLFSGGALLQLSIFALGVMPYITATIIVQLLRVVIPHFETLYKEGQAGQAKLTQYTRYLTIALALLQSTTLVTVARSGQLFGSAGVPECQQLLTNDIWWAQLLMIITMTAGTGLVMWFAELVTERGVGNGMSILIFTSIAATFPGAMISILNARGVEVFLLVLAGEHRHRGARRLRRAVPAPHPGAVRQAHGGSSYLRWHEHVHPHQGQHGRCRPRHLRLVAAVHPRAHRAVQPAAGGQEPQPWVTWISQYLTRGDHPLYMLIYFLLIIGFAYFYVAITFNPVDVADNMKKYGGSSPASVRAVPRRSTSTTCSRASRCRAHLPRPHRAAAPRGARDGRCQPELPVRRGLDPHHRGCRSRDGEADRRATPAASLRRAAAMTARLLIVGPQGSGKERRASASAKPSASPSSRRATSSRQRQGRSELGLQVKSIIDGGRPDDDLTSSAVVRDRLASRMPRTDSCSTGTPATWRRCCTSTSSSRGATSPSTPSSLWSPPQRPREESLTTRAPRAVGARDDTRRSHRDATGDLRAETAAPHPRRLRHARHRRRDRRRRQPRDVTGPYLRGARYVAASRLADGDCVSSIYKKPAAALR